MAPKVFDRMIKLFLNVGAGITVALFMWFLNNRQIHANQLAKKIDDKVDKVEFVEFKNENKKDHKEIESEIKTEFSNDLEKLEERLNREADLRNESLVLLIKSISK